jgi:isopentenyl-diphosphate delta-isomerase
MTTKPSYEHVVLVDEDNNVIGTTPKSEVHTMDTPLHRAFSLFLFRSSDKKFLIQQRHHSKKTWPLVWSNSCCGHLELFEESIDAVRRRTKFELGISNFDILVEASPYRYRFERDGVVENEICPVFFGVTDDEVNPHPEEIEAFEWIAWDEFKNRAFADDNTFSEWCKEELVLLEISKPFQKFMDTRS